MKRIFLRKENKSKPTNEIGEESSCSPNNLRKVVSQKELLSKRKEVPQVDRSKVKIKMVKRGPFPSERLYNIEKIKSAQASLSNIQTPRARNIQDDSLYK